MDTARIAELLQPFLAGVSSARSLSGAEDSSFRAGFSPDESAVLSETQLQYISTYIDLLLRWNARLNMTAVREPEEIVTRHFGESLFVARCLFSANDERQATNDVLDIGSGAGFPGLPIKIWAPQLQLTLIESNQKKATFLHEVIRSLTLTDVDVFSGRAEHFTGTGDVVTLRAVERFDRTLPILRRLLAPDGRLALLIGEGQAAQARELLPDLAWLDPIPVPQSSKRILMLGISPPNQTGHASSS